MLLAHPTNGTLFGLDAKVLILVFGLACASVQSGGHPRVQSSPPPIRHATELFLPPRPSVVVVLGIVASSAVSRRGGSVSPPAPSDGEE